MSFLFIRASQDIENNTKAFSPALKLNYDITPISPRGRDAIQSRSSTERAGISSFRRNVWLRVYCLGGETYKPIIPLFLRSLAENREKKRKEADTRRNELKGTGKKSVFYDPLSDVAGRRAVLRSQSLRTIEFPFPQML